MVYTFECRKCGHIFDQFYKILQIKDPKPLCELCGIETQRIISAGFPPNIVFIDNPAKSVTWSKKELKWFGDDHGSQGSAEKCRIKRQSRINDAIKEERFYNR